MTFHRLYETPADQGGGEAPVAEAPVEEAPVEDVGGEEAPEETYTRAELEAALQESLGPQWERFAPHGGLDALKHIGQSYNEAVGLIGRGAHLEPQDDDVYERLGVQAPQFEEPEEEEYVPPLYGAPWTPPESWDELVDLAQPVRANGTEGSPKAAFEFVANRSDVDDATKARFFANWAHYDQAGAFAYQQGAIQAETDRRVAEIEERISARLQPVENDRMLGNATNMLNIAAQQIQGFYENRPAIIALMNERSERYPNYQEWFFQATLDQQLNEMRDLTAAAVFRAQPELEQEAADEEAAAEQAKVRAKTETGRTGASPSQSGAQSELKKKNLSDFQTLKDQGLL